MQANHIVLSRLLPKTGQEIEYKEGDDGTYEAGWWRGLLNENNRTRFISKTIDDDDVVIDRAIGLMWAADGNKDGCWGGAIGIWEDAISFINGRPFAGFKDWRLPNVIELLSIVNYGKFYPCIDEPPFANTKTDYHWSSTTCFGYTTKAYQVSFIRGEVEEAMKIRSAYMRAVRGGL